MTNFNNCSEIIDSRDVIEKVEELENMLDAWIEDYMEEKGLETLNHDEIPTDQDEYWDILEELQPLWTLAEEGSNYASDWQHGETLIHEDYFQEYAQDLAEDCGMINPNENWPNNHIDWEAAAKELKIDYTTVDYDGTDYYIRSC